MSLCFRDFGIVLMYSVFVLQGNSLYRPYLLVSHPGLGSRVSSLPPLGSSDQVVLECCLKSFPRTVPSFTRLRRLWRYDEVDF